MARLARWATRRKLRIDCLADDLVALLDHLGIEQAVVGGISLGSAVAVNLRCVIPERVIGAGSVAAGVDRSARCQRTCGYILMIAELLRSVGAKEGLERFRRTAEYQAMERESPDCAKSLVGQFEQPRAVECARETGKAGRRKPCQDRALYQNIKFRCSCWATGRIRFIRGRLPRRWRG